MSEPSDEQLLSRWARRRDEEAFQILLRRYAGFVYGAALRRVGEARLAEEIAQDVFARLSHHAHRLAGHPTLAGWLHRATMLLSLARRRQKTRYERKLTQFATMKPSPNEPDPWAEALPKLDAALDQLASRDRDILMLHFAERLSFPEIAKRCGSTADAWRMRVNRALAALATMLRKKGVVVPAAMLATALSSAFAQAAPAALSTLTTAILAGSGKADVVSTLIHAMQTTKTAQVAATIALLVLFPAAIFLQQREIHALESRIGQGQQERPDAAAVGSGTDAVGIGMVNAQQWRGDLDLMRLGELALSAERLTGRGYLAARDIHQAVARLDNNNLAGLIETVLHGGMLPHPREKLLTQLLLELRKRDLALYADCYLKVLREAVPNAKFGDDFGNDLRMGAQAAFREWAGKDPVAAAKWTDEHAEEWSQLKGGSLQKLRVAGLLLSNPPAAFALMAKMPLAECLSVIDQAREDDGKLPVMDVIHWAGKRPDAYARQTLIIEALRSQRPAEGQSRLAAVEPILAGLELREEDRLAVATRSAKFAASPTGKTFDELRELQFAWLERMLRPDELSYAQGALLGSSDHPKDAYQFISAKLERSSDDALIAGYINAPVDQWREFTPGLNDTAERAEAGFRLAIHVADSMKRSTLLDAAWAELQRKAPERVAALLEIPELAETDRALLRSKISPSNGK
jgi:RNA polymerase sigma factor (sigma-70 family)